MQHDLNKNTEISEPIRFDESERHDDFEAHADEKWLISYADLMTLLFGLFVMLYVITVQRQGNVQSSFQQISDQMVRNPSSVQVNNNISTQKKQKYTDAQFLAAYYENQKLKKTLIDLNKELDILRPKAHLTSNVDPELVKQMTDKIKIAEDMLNVAQKKVDDLMTENENLKTENLNIKNQISVLENENRILKNKIISLQSEKEKLLAENKQQQIRINELDKLLQQAKIQLANLEKENKLKDQKINSLVQDIDRYKKEISELTATVDKNNQLIASMKSEIKNIRQDLKNQQEKNRQLLSENKTLLSKIASLNNELNETKSELTRTNENLKQAQIRVQNLELDNKNLIAKKNEYEFILGKVNIDSPNVPSKPIRDLASIKTKISNASVLTLEQQKKLQSDLMQSQQQVTDLSLKMNSLSKELAETIRIQNSFLMVSVIWTTSKHDIDLKVRDPNGNVYTYKSSRKPSSVGEFIMDSRTGPGMEAWHSLKFVPGEYEATVEFYNNYGNESPADINLVASTNGGRFEVAKISMDFKQQKTYSIRFKLDSSGNITK